MTIMITIPDIYKCTADGIGLVYIDTAVDWQISMQLSVLLAAVEMLSAAHTHIFLS